MTTTTILILSYFFLNTFIAGMSAEKESFKELMKEDGIIFTSIVMLIILLFGAPCFALMVLIEIYKKR